jgi:phosphopantetheine--protein transferase-like protein
MLDLWLLEFDRLQENDEDFFKFLSHQEIAKSRTYIFVEDQIRYRLTRGAVRYVLSKYLLVPPFSVQFKYSKNGKPSVLTPGLEFNISHTKKYLGIAVADQPVGLDIEWVEPEMDCESLAYQVLSAGEMRLYEKLCDVSKPHFLIRAWTEKEALVKATGEGIRRPLWSYELRSIDGWRKKIDIVCKCLGQQQWLISYLGYFSNHHVSLCTLNSSPVIKVITQNKNSVLQNCDFIEVFWDRRNFFQP